MSGWLAFVGGGVMMIFVVVNPNLDIGWSQKLVFLTWLANPLLVFGWILLACKRFRGAMVAGLLALLLGVWYLSFPYWAWAAARRRVFLGS